MLFELFLGDLDEKMTSARHKRERNKNIARLCDKGLCNNYLEGGGFLRLIGRGPELKPKRRVGGVRCNFLNICKGGGG